ncbi:hypothetical protein LY76DRAFT_677679 [Colletotrichum caudatum]|nr:hypothetical protein LY76DRAFT_677679 [Colletotrichum caudatum]
MMHLVFSAIYIPSGFPRRLPLPYHSFPLVLTPAHFPEEATLYISDSLTRPQRRTTTMADSANYTVGWICALPTEFNAAKALFDEKHDDCPPVAQHDNNSYALGRIGGHNVVVAVMPSGEYGTTSAAAVARDMVHSFPNVRIGLMVGIGGGAPSPEHDVRLGDVVVSSRDGGKGGVFQYDFGKAVQGLDISFQHTDFLDQPPMVLRTAVSALESRYEMEGHQLNATVDRAFEQWPRLRKRYSRPPPGSDRLYRSDIVHPDSPNACSSVCGDDPVYLVHRAPRDEHDDNDPAVHYGLIASANTLMKDATVRDKLAAKNGVLCFEMEAAGLMNHFPCLVIRGICDYSDSHKNNQWQGFAAMMAAAYAKDLLRQIPPSKVEAEGRIGDALVLRVNEMRDDAEAARQHKYLKKLYRWLSAPDPSTNAASARTRRHPGTGAWLLESATFREWEAGIRQHLWLYGYAGCGKTVLSTIILDHLREKSPDLTLGFFFDFNNTGNQTLESLLRSLALQLYRTGGKAAMRLDYLFRANDDSQTQPGISALSACVESMLRTLPRVNIVVDALDECTTRDQLLSWIRGLASGPGDHNIKMIVTGRPEAEFECELLQIFENNCTLLDKKAIDADIRSYVNHELYQRPDFVGKRLPQDVVEQIITRIGDGADGMFRWAACQLDAIAKCLHLRAIQEALENLPSTLNETYKRMLQNIPPEFESDAIRLLQFLVHGGKPLRLPAAIDVIATQPDGEERGFYKDRRLFRKEDILRYCPSLVVITIVPQSEVSEEEDWSDDQEDEDEDDEDKDDEDEEEDYEDEDEDYEDKDENDRIVKEIHLAHFSVKEYLTRDERFQLAAASVAIAKTCLVYLIYVVLHFSFPLKKYAQEVWMHHARLAEHSDDVVFQLSQRYIRVTASLNQSGFFTTLLTLPNILGIPCAAPATLLSEELYCACEAGLLRVSRSILERGADVNARVGQLGNVLQNASLNGHREVVQLLLDAGANVSAKGGSYGNALKAASYSGHQEISTQGHVAPLSILPQMQAKHTLYNYFLTMGQTSTQNMMELTPPFILQHTTAIKRLHRFF